MVNFKPEAFELKKLNYFLYLSTKEYSFRVIFLSELNFIPTKKSFSLSLYKWREILSDKADPMNVLISFLVILPTLFLVSFFLIKDIVKWIETFLLLLEVLIIFLAFLATYFSWTKNQKSKNLDDYILRKDMTNEMIMKHNKLLMPFAGNVFGYRNKFLNKYISKDNESIITMYIYSELDNLEFVFEKSRSKLLAIDYTFRALRIFLARAENESFNRLATKLIFEGRYNEDFQRTAIKLLFLAKSESPTLQLIH